MTDHILVPLYASIRDVGATRGLSRATINRLMVSGKFRAVKSGSKILLDLASVDSYFAGLPEVYPRAQQAA